MITCLMAPACESVSPPATNPIKFIIKSAAFVIRGFCRENTHYNSKWILIPFVDWPFVWAQVIVVVLIKSVIQSQTFNSCESYYEMRKCAAYV